MGQRWKSLTSGWPSCPEDPAFTHSHSLTRLSRFLSTYCVSGGVVTSEGNTQSLSLQGQRTDRHTCRT